MEEKKLLCTLGPASFNKKTITRFEELGVNLFRINLSHTKAQEVKERIEFIRKYSSIPICLDSEGAQIRTGSLSVKEMFLKVNQKISLSKNNNDSQLEYLPMYPTNVESKFRVGDLLNIDFDSALIQIISIDDGRVIAKVISSGWVGNNKAVTSLRAIDLPALTEKDKEAIQIGLDLGIKNFALSFASSAEDVEEFRSLVGSESIIISKIESKKGYASLKSILAKTDAILIDRGDLSREIQIELVPFYQEKIVKQAIEADKPVYIATNLLETMIEKPYPTRAEVSDIVGILTMGVQGVVLAAETAIGKFPIESVVMVKKLMQQFELSKVKDLTDDPNHDSSVLVKPHGGTLVKRFDKHADWNFINSLKKLTVADTVIMDCEQIAIGTYSPLSGFMTQQELSTVLDTYILPNGTIWTLPILLQKKYSEIKNINVGEEIALVNELDNEVYAVLKVSDIYELSFDDVCLKWFTTNSKEHPGVVHVKNSGDYCLGGEITLVKRRACEHHVHSFTPSELRYIFDNKGWSQIVGFHTRNIPHRGHEAIQKIALEQTHCDGLLSSPVIGQKKDGDFSSKVLLKSYDLMIEHNFLPTDNTFIGAFSTYSRYSGAREAVFTALCRKNFGCSHFIIGRDHTGTGNFYAPDASQQLFKQLGDIGITPVFFDEVKYCPDCDEHVAQCEHNDSIKQSISGTKVREFLSRGEKPPAWLMREEISEMVIKYAKDGKEVFV